MEISTTQTAYPNPFKGEGLTGHVDGLIGTNFEEDSVSIGGNNNVVNEFQYLRERLLKLKYNDKMMFHKEPQVSVGVERICNDENLVLDSYNLKGVARGLTLDREPESEDQITVNAEGIAGCSSFANNRSRQLVEQTFISYREKDGYIRKDVEKFSHDTIDYGEDKNERYFVVVDEATGAVVDKGIKNFQENSSSSGIMHGPNV